MFIRVILLVIIQIFITSEKKQIPKIYDFYVYTKTYSSSPNGRPSKCDCDKTTIKISLNLKKDFSFILRNSMMNGKFIYWESTSFGNWHLTPNNKLLLNIISSEVTTLMKGTEKPDIKHFNNHLTKKLEFIQNRLRFVYENDKEFLPRGKLMKFNKKRRKKIYGGK